MIRTLIEEAEEHDSSGAVATEGGDGGGGRPVVIAAIDGTGGVGKSSLVIHAAHQLADRFPDGQLYVDLHGATAGLTALDPGEVLGRFLRALGVDGSTVPSSTDEASAQFRSLAAGRRLLVILDNAASVEQVRPLLPAGPGCSALVTSREMLTTLEGATHLHLDVLPRDQAVALLERIVGAERVRAEPEEAEAITRLCGGLPLALRIAGARLAARPGRPLRTLVTKLTDVRGRLDELSFGDLAVRTSFQVSYDGFREGRRSDDLDAARAFRLLGALPGPDVSLPVATALLGLSESRTESALERLVDAQLLESPDSIRYHMHDLLRLFATERGEQEDSEAERSTAVARGLSCYLATAQQAVTLLDPLRPGRAPRRRRRRRGPAGRQRGGGRLAEGRTPQPAGRRRLRRGAAGAGGAPRCAAGAVASVVSLSAGARPGPAVGQRAGDLGRPPPRRPGERGVVTRPPRGCVLAAARVRRCPGVSGVGAGDLA
ncbi:NB-ARC domain-containing protein [Streptomyces sp. FXJ1.4098]|nr:NB-ARC domain-containing protein [Streptomyces sp. FXJ1.4098]